MNGRDLTLGLVGALAVGAALGRRGSRSLSPARHRDLDALADAYHAYARELGRDDPDLTDAENERFARQHGVGFLGAGITRAVFRVPEGALKIDMGWPAGSPPYTENAAEAKIWASAPAALARHLVPILAHAEDYRWVLMPEVKVGGRVTPEGREVLEGCGLSDFVENRKNVARDGRLVDYARIESGDHLRACLERGRAQRGSRVTLRLTGRAPTGERIAELRDRFFDALEAEAGERQVIYMGPFVVVGDRKGGILGKLEIYVRTLPTDGRVGVSLSYIGVGAGERQQGRGTRLMQTVLAAADAAGLPVYLEVSPQKQRGDTKPPMNKKQLRAFYEKFGFRTVRGMGADYMQREAAR